MDRREVLKGSLAGAAVLGIAPKGTVTTIHEGIAAVDGQIQSGVQAEIGQTTRQTVLASLYDYERAAKAKLSLPAWEY
ncbi:MAG TPA: hypothetical protein VGR71_13510, partial [Nitrospira sp.]|nr:hypothetical protein [Nitrospira sp.]